MQPQTRQHGAVADAVRKALKSVRSPDGTFKVAEVLAKVETEVPGSPRPTVYATIARMSQHVKNGTRKVVKAAAPTKTPGSGSIRQSETTNLNGTYYTMRGGWTKDGTFISSKQKREIVKREFRKVWDLFPKIDGFVERSVLVSYANHLGISYAITQEALTDMVEDGVMERRRVGGQKGGGAALYRFAETSRQKAERVLSAMPEFQPDPKTASLHVPAGTIEDVDAAIDAWLDRRIKERLSLRIGS